MLMAAVDEGAVADDDEDGSSDEDWYDPLVFYLAGSSLVQRTPVPWDVDSSGSVTGAGLYRAGHRRQCHAAAGRAGCAGRSQPDR